MDRINGLNTTVLASGKRGWVNKNAAAGVPGTQIDATSYMNPQQEELVGGLIEWAGLTPDAADWTQIQQALQIKFAQVGAGLRQQDNQVKIGYTAAGTVAVTIDATDEGDIAFRSWVQAGFLPGLFKTGIGVGAASGATVLSATVTFASPFPNGCSLALAQPVSQANSSYGYFPTAACTAFNASAATFKFDTLTGVGSTTAVNFNQTFYFNWLAWGF